MDEPGGAGLFPGCPGRPFNVGADEDDNPDINRPQAADAGSHHAGDDAVYVLLPVNDIPQRPGALLVDHKYNHCCNTVFYYRLGRLTAGKKQEGTGAG